jgi:hypothetical protein
MFLVERWASMFGARLVGVLMFGSWARRDLTEADAEQARASVVRGVNAVEPHRVPGVDE